MKATKFEKVFLAFAGVYIVGRIAVSLIFNV